jgi:hypothetical protein
LGALLLGRSRLQCDRLCPQTPEDYRQKNSSATLNGIIGSAKSS